jgi:uncharacterized protein (DUF58 family)
MNNKFRLVALISFCLFIVALITHNGSITWMMLPFLAYLGIGILQSPGLEKLSLQAQRKLVQTRFDGTMTFDASVSVQNTSSETVYICIDETAQSGMKITDGKLNRKAALLPSETTEMKYTFTAARGNYSWKHVRVLVSDPLDLIQSEFLLPGEISTQAQPPLKKFIPIWFRPHSTLHSPGSIPARLGGSGTDFFGVREYHPDWRLTARHPRKFFTKEFEQEEIAEIGLILDARQSTNPKIGNDCLFEHSISAAVSLAEMFLHQGHRVSLLTFGNKMLNVYPGYGKTQLQQILACLSKVKVEEEDQSYSSLDFIPIRMFPSKALIIIISSLAEIDLYLFQRLKAYGYQTIIISPNPIAFSCSTFKQDTLNDLAIQATRLERQLLLTRIAYLRIPVIDWQVDCPLYPLVRNVLSRARGSREL